MAAAIIAVVGLVLVAVVWRWGRHARAELERVSQDHDRLKAVLDGMAAAVFAVDAAGQITVCNPAMRTMFNLEGDPIGRRYDEVLTIPKLHDCVTEAQEGRTVRMEMEVRAPERRHLVAYASPHPAGAEVAVVLRDVTGIRLLERVRRDFVANVSHELRTPVSVIQASAETLLNGALEDTVHAHNFVLAISRHASRLTHIIQGLLDLARLEAGQRGLAREPVNIRAAALRALDLVADPAQERGIHIEVDVPGQVFAKADTKGVDQVLANLLQNAVKYSDEGGHIWVTAEEDGDVLRVSVADDGPGIKAKHRVRVFERFYRVDKGRSRDHGGTGLGLAIVKHLVLAMGGTVGVDPREPRGSEFWMRLKRYKRLPGGSA